MLHFRKPGALYTIISVLAILLELAVCAESQVNWISPSAGDQFGPGDSLVGKWTAKKAVVSPSFKLCEGSPQSSLSSRSGDTSSDGCGENVYPTVQEDSGTYLVSLTIPNTASKESYYLMMMDDFDNKYTSPSFFIAPSAEPIDSSASNSNQDDSEPVIDTVAQSPLAAPTSTTSSPSVTVTAVQVAQPDSATQAGSDSNVATRTPLSTVAFAVPLSIVGAILLVACGLALRHNHNLKEDRVRDVEKLTLSRAMNSTESYKSGYSRQSDIEHALSVLSKNDKIPHAQPITNSYAPVPVPLFMPMEMPVRAEPRRFTREAYYPSSRDEYYQSPSRNRGYGEKRNKERPPSYRTSPSSASIARRSPSTTYSDSYTARPSSRSRHTHSQYSESRHSRMPSPLPQSRSQSRSSRPCLPPLRIGSPLQSGGSFNGIMDNERQHIHYKNQGEVTHSVLDDYVLPEPGFDSSSLSSLPPPLCLLPAPQRLHVRNEGAAEPHTDIVNKFEEHEMVEIDLYDAVARSIRSGGDAYKAVCQ